MGQYAEILKEKEQKLKELRDNKSKAFCVEEHGSASNMKFEMEIEELEDEIADLKKKISIQETI